jgi:hypothetical protein
VGESCVAVSPEDTYFLVFETETTPFARFGTFQPQRKTQRPKAPAQMWILDREGNHCGVFFNRLPEGVTPDAEGLSLIAFSYGNGQSGKLGHWYGSEGTWIDTRKYSAVYPKGNGKYGETNKVVNIMLIKWMPLGSMEGARSAERVGIGVIHKDAWLKASPMQAVISLA